MSSQFHEYAVRADQIAKETFEEYNKANDAVKQAEAKAREWPEQHGTFIDAKKQEKHLLAKAKVINAKEALRSVVKGFEGKKRELADIRSELEEAVNTAFSADSAAIDDKELELLKSGILHASEYSDMMDKSMESCNYTMARLIGRYAGLTAKDREGKPFADKEYVNETTRLREIENRGMTADGREYLSAFDAVIDVFGRCCNNPFMMQDWDSLLAETIDNF